MIGTKLAMPAAQGKGNDHSAKHAFKNDNPVRWPDLTQGRTGRQNV